MSDGFTQLDVRYQPRHCTFLKLQVWAIRTKQSNGKWRIVNCLDKDAPCYAVECCFTTDHGAWPYTDRATESA